MKALRNYLRGPSDDDALRAELYALVRAGVMTREQADATMAAGNRAIFCLEAMSATLRKADPDPTRDLFFTAYCPLTRSSLNTGCWLLG